MIARIMTNFFSISQRIITGFLLSSLLMSCAYLSKQTVIQNRDKTYLSATSIPPLKIPPGISSDAFESYYPVSNREYPKASQNVSILPPGIHS